MKLMGAVLILLSSFCAAFTLLAGSRESIRRLHRLSSALSTLRTELERGTYPLATLCCTMRSEAEGTQERFFTALSKGMEQLGERSFSEIWQEAAELVFPGDQAQWKRDLSALGQVLGRSRLEEQILAIRRCEDELVRAANEKQASFRSASRMVWGFSLSAGALIILLLL